MGLLAAKVSEWWEHSGVGWVGESAIHFTVGSGMLDEIPTNTDKSHEKGIGMSIESHFIILLLIRIHQT